MSSALSLRREPLVVLLAACCAALLLAFAWRGPLAVWPVAALALGLPVALMALGARRSGAAGKPARSRRLAIGLVVLLALLEGAGLGIVAFAGRGVVTAGGLPVGLVLLLAGLWALPLVVSGWVFAASFDGFLPPDDLERVRRARAAEGP
jgi:hypothetical protein